MWGPWKPSRRGHYHMVVTSHALRLSSPSCYNETMAPRGQILWLRRRGTEAMSLPCEPWKGGALPDPRLFRQPSMGARLLADPGSCPPQVATLAVRALLAPAPSAPLWPGCHRLSSCMSPCSWVLDIPTPLPGLQ